MIKVSKIVIALLLGASVLSTTASADAAKGQKLYQKKLKDACGINGGVFAAKHTQAEWADAEKSGNLNALFEEICPAAKEIIESDKFQERYKSDIYDFVHDYASDSGNVPSC
jgi:hypothetical protein